MPFLKQQAFLGMAESESRKRNRLEGGTGTGYFGERSSRETRKASRQCPPGALPMTGLGKETRVGKGTEDEPSEEKPSAKKVT